MVFIAQHTLVRSFKTEELCKINFDAKHDKEFVNPQSMYLFYCMIYPLCVLLK